MPQTNEGPDLMTKGRKEFLFFLSYYFSPLRASGLKEFCGLLFLRNGGLIYNPLLLFHTHYFLIFTYS